jgi:hypothetical protein
MSENGSDSSFDSDASLDDLAFTEEERSEQQRLWVATKKPPRNASLDANNTTHRLKNAMTKKSAGERRSPTATT